MKLLQVRGLGSLYKKICGRKCVGGAGSCWQPVRLPACILFAYNRAARICQLVLAARIRLLAKKSVKNILILVFSAY